MECLEAKALKSSFHWELATKEDVVEEVWCLNGANIVSGDDFEVDEFFNFSNGDLEHGSALRVREDDDDEEFDKDGLSFSSEERLEDDGSSNSNQSGVFPAAVEDSKSHLADELAIPGDALADLEWVSQFVDDYGSEFSMSCPAVKTQVEAETFLKRNRPEPEREFAGAEISCFLSPFPVRPRTKRPRQSRQTRSTGCSPNQSPSSSSSSTSSGVSSTPIFMMFTDAGENVDSSNAPYEAPKKQRKRPALQGGSSSLTGQLPRRCSHCFVQKTPQWRTGPNGAKTLCNACGVRYKSGRLFPEYRPALSPTFCSGVHSNSHRKVLEMRKSKDDVPEATAELTRIVPSY